MGIAVTKSGDILSVITTIPPLHCEPLTSLCHYNDSIRHCGHDPQLQSSTHRKSVGDTGIEAAGHARNDEQGQIEMRLILYAGICN
ncbi:MAG: hypothetical protein LBH60_02900 [Prevotellaceae bacterium]|jgi:hypothetical protein|nr:hypothetical protein [Prevotellaceae bacterium]